MIINETISNIELLVALIHVTPNQNNLSTICTALRAILNLAVQSPSNQQIIGQTQGVFTALTTILSSTQANDEPLFIAAQYVLNLLTPPIPEHQYAPKPLQNPREAEKRTFAGTFFSSPSGISDVDDSDEALAWIVNCH